MAGLMRIPLNAPGPRLNAHALTSLMSTFDVCNALSNMGRIISVCPRPPTTVSVWMMVLFCKMAMEHCSKMVSKAMRMSDGWDDKAVIRNKNCYVRTKRLSYHKMLMNFGILKWVWGVDNIIYNGEIIEKFYFYLMLLSD